VTVCLFCLTVRISN